MWKRVAPVAIAAVITAAIVFVLSSAFRADNTVTPAVPAVADDRTRAGRGPRRTRVLPIAQEGGFTSAREAFGSLWTVEILSGVEQLQRRNVETGAMETTFSIPVSGGGEWGGDGIEVGAGSVWVRGRNSATVFAIDPATDAVERFPLDGQVVSDIAIDEQGLVWASVSVRGGERRDRPTGPRVWTGDPR